MLQKVHTTWIKGVLNQSLYSVARLELGLTTQPDTVEEVWDVLVQRPHRPMQQLSPGTRISKAFDELGQALLILGAPGTGKTTLLLELAKDLLDRAGKDLDHAIPVVFNLSSWAVRQASLSDWLVDELSKRYQVPGKHAQSWVDKDLILPLLDGLDEVAAEHRSACVEAINAFRANHGLIPLAVCSRVSDYEVLTTKLHLQCALVVQPLTREQTKRYLAQAGKSLQGVYEALQDDEILWELLDTPLMLSIAVLAYQGRSASEVQTTGTLEERKKQLFATYTEAMFRRRSNIFRYSPQLTIHWLAWLASAMSRHNQSVFYLELTQPDWLSSKSQERIVNLGVILLSGLANALVSWPILAAIVLIIAGTNLSVGSGRWEVEWQLLATKVSWFAMNIGGPAGLLMGLGAVIWARTSEIQPVETVRWAWSEINVGFARLVNSGVFGGLFGYLIGISVSLLDGKDAIEVIDHGLVGAMFGAPVGGLVGILSGALVSSDITTRVTPNEGIRRSLRNALLLGLLSWLFIALTGLFSAPLGWLFFKPLENMWVIDLTVGWFIGLFVGLRNGGIACFQHLTLRFLLWYNTFAPWHYVRFLDYAAERLFLRKVGGGYIFIHRMLLEYFAALHPVEAKKLK